jgi:ABC-type polysaccharide/polyol phosphate transport system ATPase subunit
LQPRLVTFDYIFVWWQLYGRTAVLSATKAGSVHPVSDYAIDAVGISKRFRLRGAAGQSSLKDIFTRRARGKRFGVVNALEDVTFCVRRGQTLGVIGQNGSGKTTLLRILAGITKPERGDVRVRGNVAPLLALATGFNPYLSGRENALIELLTLGLSRAEAKNRLDEVIAFAEIGAFIDEPMRTYSSGMAMRLAFAAATRIDPEILLIDEILSVGDEGFAVKCAAWLDDYKRRGNTSVIVTHNTGMVASQCDVALWLHKGCVAGFGDPTEVVHAYLQCIRSEGSATAGGAVHYQVSMNGLLPLVRLPLIGKVRQFGEVQGAFGDGWTNGNLEFAFEPLRSVRTCEVRATIPVGMPETASISAEIDGEVIQTVPASPGEVRMRCSLDIPQGQSVRMRIASSQTVNHKLLGISGDVRDLGARIDEIIFEH